MYRDELHERTVEGILRFADDTFSKLIISNLYASFVLMFISSTCKSIFDRASQHGDLTLNGITVSAVDKVVQQYILTPD
jgi:hypothetical protein